MNKHIKYAINPEGSLFTFEQLVVILQQNLDFISLVTGHTFEVNPVPSTKITGDQVEEVIRFRPDDEFSSPTQLALAAAGIKFNIARMVNYDLVELRELMLHELGHRTGIKHTQDPFSVMSTYRFRSSDDKSLLWRKDLIDYHNYAPRDDQSVVGRCSINEEFAIMVPAFLWDDGTGNGVQEWSFKLRYVQGGNYWLVNKSYKGADDGVNMQVMASAVVPDPINDPEYVELQLRDAFWIVGDTTFVVPLVRFSIDGDKLRIVM